MNAVLRVCLLCAAAFAIAALAQQDPFQDVPADKREQLRADIARAIDLQKHRRWKEFYAVYDKEYPGMNGRPLDLRELSKVTRLVEFLPMTVKWNDKQGAWLVNGCASLDEPHTNMGRGGVYSGMTVRYVNGVAKFLPVMNLWTKEGYQRCTFVRNPPPKTDN